MYLYNNTYKIKFYEFNLFNLICEKKKKIYFFAFPKKF